MLSYSKLYLLFMNIITTAFVLHLILCLCSSVFLVKGKKKEKKQCMCVLHVSAFFFLCRMPNSVGGKKGQTVVCFREGNSKAL